MVYYFDCVNDAYDSIETLINLGIDRVLTSGLEEKAIYGMKLLKDLHEKYGIIFLKQEIKFNILNIIIKCYL
ncbi:copper homeostasis protein CutC [Clostridium moniliforme]|uniref:copper homeostasis protein CutC n=1 Tax=Clostridium moniliforme TaxID=39489 RepID=UPI001AE548E4|nr:copper homeostasis protein CutC [Clostridium moniliforme]